jgi:hypothetical protein
MGPILLGLGDSTGLYRAGWACASKLWPRRV